MASTVADLVIGLSSDGRVITRGSASEAFSRVEGLQVQADEEISITAKTEEEIDGGSVNNKQNKKISGKLVLTEEIAEGHVSWEACKLVARA